MITEKQIEILRHTVGADSKSPGFRNRYVTEIDNKDVLALKDLGLMSGPYFIADFGDNQAMFTATNNAKILMNIGKLEKLQKTVNVLESQRNDYREFWLSKKT